MKRFSKPALIAAIALTLTSAACGNDAPVGKFTDDQACTVATGSVGKFATAMLPWLYKTAPSAQTPESPDHGAMYHGEFQERLHTVSTELASSADDFTAALKAGDDAKMRSLQESARTKADELINSCTKIGWTKPDTIADLRETLNKTPDSAIATPSAPAAEPTSSKAPKPVALTPAGATVKVGEKVVFELPKPRRGYATPIEYTITKIEKAPAGAIPVEGEEAAKIKQFFYIRAKAEHARDEDTNTDAVPFYDVRPTYRVTMSDGAKNGAMSGARDFKPCRNDDGEIDEAEYCAVWGTVSENGTVAKVELIGVTSDSSKDAPAMYTWKNE
ncbi:hypothetical protein [Gordonia araii]|uniref:hypothetical protein n=1 Tax=Gordonia araii TaxID=263909 RepID=UPI00058EB656|nr:hypothetical protein [Gordonia araii]